MRIVIVAIFGMLCSFCSNRTNLSEKEEFILDSMKEYTLIGENGEESSLLDVVMEFESVLISNQYLRSVSKKDYELFYDQFIIGDSLADVRLVYETNNLFIALGYASTQARSWYIFDTATKNMKLNNVESSTIFNIHRILEGNFDQFSISENLFHKYLNSLSNEEFESKSIYRVPLLIIFYLELEKRYYDSTLNQE